MSGEAVQYQALAKEFADHDAVDHHHGEYAYADRKTGVIVPPIQRKATFPCSSAA